MVDLSRVKERDSLKPQREPYWQRLGVGRFIGYRPSAKREGCGTWIARAYDEDTQRYRLKALGDYGREASNFRFGLAKNDAEGWCDQVARGGELRIDTVGDACRRYSHRGGDISARFERRVFGDPIAKVQLRKLRKSDVESWRVRLEQAPALVSRAKDKPPLTRPRSAASINRDMATLRAALNQAYAKGDVSSSAPWREALRPIRNADRQRTKYLDRAQRRLILESLPPDASAFFRTMCLLPLRPGAAAQLKVSDFELRTRQLTIGRDKNGRPRQILLSTPAAEHLAAQTADKLPSAILLSRANGQPWTKESWKIPLKDAVEASGLESGITAYTLRHSVISDLVTDGLSLLAVAQISGTSVQMIERHYGHLNDEVAAMALSRLAI